MRQYIPLAVLLLAAAPPLRADWPDFRGPNRDGIAAAKDLPVRWSETENIAWKTPIPHKGWSSPVILDGKVWVTTATEDGKDYFVYALDEASGKVVIEKKLFHCDKPEPLGNKMNGYASPSAVLEPGRAYVHFGSYGTACLDAADGKVIWERTDLPCRHFRGPGSSPFLYKNLLILTMDGIDVQYVAALDKKTGTTKWKTDRTADFGDLGADGKPAGGGDVRKAYNTPTLVEVGGKPRC